MHKFFLLFSLLLNNFLLSYDSSGLDNEYFLYSPKINYFNEDYEISNEEIAQVLLGARHLLKEVEFSIFSTIDSIIKYDLEDGTELFQINGLLVPEYEPYNLQINKKLISDGIGLIPCYKINYEEKAYKPNKCSDNENEDCCFFTTNLHSSAESIESVTFLEVIAAKPKNTQVALALLALRCDLAKLDISSYPIISNIQMDNSTDGEAFTIEGCMREKNQLLDYFSLVITKRNEIDNFTPSYTLKKLTGKNIYL